MSCAIALQDKKFFFWKINNFIRSLLELDITLDKHGQNVSGHVIYFILAKII